MSYSPFTTPNPTPNVTAPNVASATTQVLVTPLRLLNTQPAMIDCLFCKKTTRTKVQVIEQDAENSGYDATQFILHAKLITSQNHCMSCMSRLLSITPLPSMY